MKILEFLRDVRKSWKSTIPCDNQENHKQFKIKCEHNEIIEFLISQETYENHKNLWTPYADLENHESRRILQENHENH